MKSDNQVDRSRFFSISLFQKIKDYLNTAGKDAPPVIGTTENFCEPDPPRVNIPIGMVVTAAPAPTKKKPTMAEALSETHVPGAADLVNKLIEEESHVE